MRRVRVAGLLLFFTILSVGLQAQSFLDSTSLKFSGFIKADYVYDSRQIVDSRENLFLFYPKDNSKASHDQSTYNQYALISRLRADISGGRIFNARSSAVLEGDFSGASNADIDGFRLRHAYFRLDWEKTSVLFGQYWHPLTVPGAFPKVLSLNIGAPFHAFNRGPQARLDHRLGKLTLTAVAVTQRDFANNGPLGYSPQYMYKGGHPDFHGQFKLQLGAWTLGAGAGYKAIAPELGNKDIDKTLSAISAVGYLQLKTKRSRLVLQSVYGENLYDHLMMGGYTVFNYDSTNNTVELRNEPTTTYWADYTFKFNSGWSAGCFAGFAQNHSDELYTNANWYFRGAEIDYVYRFAPRIIKNIKNLMAGLEMEYTAALYNHPGQSEDLAENYRLSLVLLYRF